MAATGTPTTNLGLRITNGTDAVDNADINANSQILDEKIGAVPSGKSVQGEIVSLSNQLADLQTVSSCADAYGLLSGQDKYGRARVGSGASDSPIAGRAWIVESYRYSSNYGFQAARSTDDDKEYRRHLSAGAWSSWESLSDKISSFDLNGTISNGTNTITVTKTSFVIFVFRGNTGKFYVGFCSDGYFTMPSGMCSDNDVSISISGTTVTITSNYQYDMRYRIISA